MIEERGGGGVNVEGRRCIFVGRLCTVESV
jgi:hypothetical protein